MSGADHERRKAPQRSRTRRSPLVSIGSSRFYINGVRVDPDDPAIAARRARNELDASIEAESRLTEQLELAASALGRNLTEAEIRAIAAGGREKRLSGSSPSHVSVFLDGLFDDLFGSGGFLETALQPIEGNLAKARAHGRDLAVAAAIERAQADVKKLSEDEE